jgi:hypothetical protein
VTSAIFGKSHRETFRVSTVFDILHQINSFPARFALPETTDSAVEFVAVGSEQSIVPLSSQRIIREKDVFLQQYRVWHWLAASIMTEYGTELLKRQLNGE